MSRPFLRLALLSALALPLLAAAQDLGGPPPPNEVAPGPGQRVPEPASLWLAGLAIGGLVAARRRRK